MINTNLNLNISPKNNTEIEEATNKLISTLQEAAKQATPLMESPDKNINIPTEIKRLIVEKRKARAKWHRSHTPDDKNTYNRLSNTLKQKLKQMRDDSFSQYITNLSRHDNSIWQAIKASRKPVTAIPPIRNEAPNTTSWARSNEEKADLFSRHLAEIFTPLNDIPD